MSGYGPAADEDRLIFEKKGQSGVNFDRVELGNSAPAGCDSRSPAFSDGGHFFIVGMVVPGR